MPPRLSDKPPADSGGPLRRLGSGVEPYERRLVDQPGRHDHAARITSASPRSANVSQKRASDSTVTSLTEVRRSSVRPVIGIRMSPYADMMDRVGMVDTVR